MIPVFQYISMHRELYCCIIYSHFIKLLCEMESGTFLRKLQEFLPLWQSCTFFKSCMFIFYGNFGGLGRPFRKHLKSHQKLQKLLLLRGHSNVAMPGPDLNALLLGSRVGSWKQCGGIFSFSLVALQHLDFFATLILFLLTFQKQAYKNTNRLDPTFAFFGEICLRWVDKRSAPSAFSKN